MRVGFYRGTILTPWWLRWVNYLWTGKTVYADGRVINHILGRQWVTGYHAYGTSVEWILYPQFSLMDKLWALDGERSEYLGHLVGTPVWFMLERVEDET